VVYTPMDSSVVSIMPCTWYIPIHLLICHLQFIQFQWTYIPHPIFWWSCNAWVLSCPQMSNYQISYGSSSNFFRYYMPTWCSLSIFVTYMLWQPSYLSGRTCMLLSKNGAIFSFLFMWIPI
jgi:hypothetical protein